MPEPSDEPEWFEVSEKDWLPVKSTGKKLRLLADAAVPDQVVDEIRSAGIEIESLPAGSRNLEDPDVLDLAGKRGSVLLTLDRGFWDDKRYPLHRLKTGVIYVAESPDRHDRILRAFGLVYGCFARSYPLDWWGSMKVRTCADEFELKMRSSEGAVSRYRMRLRGGRLVVKEVVGTQRDND